MMINTEIPYYHGCGEFATEEYFNISSKKKLSRKELKSQLLKSVNGWEENGTIYSGDGNRIRILWKDIQLYNEEE